MQNEFLRRSKNTCFDGWRKLNSKLFIKLKAFMSLDISQECVLDAIILRNSPEREVGKDGILSLFSGIILILRKQFSVINVLKRNIILF